jgi:hypothetical protein
MKKLMLAAMLAAALALAAPGGMFHTSAWAGPNDTWYAKCRVTKGGPRLVPTEKRVVTKVWLSNQDWQSDRAFNLDPSIANELLAVILTAVAGNRQVDILVDETVPGETKQIDGMYIRND